MVDKFGTGRYGAEYDSDPYGRAHGLNGTESLGDTTLDSEDLAKILAQEHEDRQRKARETAWSKQRDRLKIHSERLRLYMKEKKREAIEKIDGWLKPAEKLLNKHALVKHNRIKKIADTRPKNIPLYRPNQYDEVREMQYDVEREKLATREAAKRGELPQFAEYVPRGDTYITQDLECPASPVLGSWKSINKEHHERRGNRQIITAAEVTAKGKPSVADALGYY